MKKFIASYILMVSLIGCGGGSDDVDPDPTPLNPEAAVLTFPEKNSECTEGTNITSTNSTILFEWNTAVNTDSYELVLKNLETDQITNHITTSNQLNIELLKGTPYSWMIVSKSSSVSNTANSETWSFYNAGEATVSYAPFPAEAVSPEKGASVTSTGGNISLDWNASDLDNDIDLYDVYFGTDSTPNVFESDLETSMLNDVMVTSGTTYYWYIITTDKQENSSKSETFWFTVN